MAGEIQLPLGTSGVNIYAVVRNASGQVWNTVGAAFENYNAANWTDYDIALTEQGVSGYYVGNFPAAVAGVYAIEARQRAGGSPAVSDSIVGGANLDWSGTAIAGIKNGVNVNAMDANVLTAAVLAADAVAEIQSGLATPASVWSHDLGDGRLAEYYQKGGFNKTVRATNSFTVYDTDDTTVLVAAVSTGDVTMPTLASVDP